MASIQPKDPRETQKKIEARKAEEERRAAAFKRHKQLFDSLARLARMNAAWITSPPGEQWLRLEAEPHSELPDKLHDAGFCLHETGTAERIEGGKILPVLCFRFQIPTPR